MWEKDGQVQYQYNYLPLDDNSMPDEAPITLTVTWQGFELGDIKRLPSKFLQGLEQKRIYNFIKHQTKLDIAFASNDLTNIEFFLNLLHEDCPFSAEIFSSISEAIKYFIGEESNYTIGIPYFKERKVFEILSVIPSLSLTREPLSLFPLVDIAKVTPENALTIALEKCHAPLTQLTIAIFLQNHIDEKYISSYGVSRWYSAAYLCLNAQSNLKNKAKQGMETTLALDEKFRFSEIEKQLEKHELDEALAIGEKAEADKQYGVLWTMANNTKDDFFKERIYKKIVPESPYYYQTQEELLSLIKIRPTQHPNIEAYHTNRFLIAVNSNNQKIMKDSLFSLLQVQKPENVPDIEFTPEGLLNLVNAIHQSIHVKPTEKREVERSTKRNRNNQPKPYRASAGFHFWTADSSLPEDVVTFDQETRADDADNDNLENAFKKLRVSSRKVKRSERPEKRKTFS